MAKPELGTKRIDPETGRKFYDLNKDPIVSPYTGKSYPRSYFETVDSKLEDEVEDKEVEADEEEGAELVTLEEADEETSGGDSDVEIDDDEDVDLGDDDDTFLEDEEEDDDVSGIVDMDEDEEEH